MKPLILITPSIVDDEKFLRLSRAYTDAVESAGGIAVSPDCAVIENIPRLLELSDGILLSGGGDIDPSFFGETPIREIGEISPLRDAYEIELVKQAAALNMPILAICRGAQLLNVAFGGKVYQDIYSQIKSPVIKHSQEMPRHYASHTVQISEGSIIERIVKSKELRVNSFHHQAVSVLAKQMKATAVASDGVIEAVEHMSMGFCVGVQWHPEHMIYKQPEQFEIFKEFIRFSINNIQGK